MSTPSQRSLERSSEVSQDRADGYVRRSSFRMRTRPRRSKERCAASSPNLQDTGDSRGLEEAMNSTRVRLDLDSDDAGAGPLPKDDAPYMGRSGGRSQVVSVQAARGIGVSIRSARSRDGGRGDDAEPFLEPPPPAQRSSTKPHPKKKVKSPEFIESSDADDDPAPVVGSKRPGGDSRKAAPSKRGRTILPERDWSFIRTPSPPSPRPPRLPSPPPLPPMVSDPELPSLLEVIGSTTSGNQPPLSMIIDEAEESDDWLDAKRPSARSDAEECMEVSTDNEYDLDDPFIDDDSLVSENSDSIREEPRRGRKKTARRARLRSASREDHSPENSDHNAGLRRLSRGQKSSRVKQEVIVEVQPKSKPRPKPRPVTKKVVLKLGGSGVPTIDAGPLTASKSPSVATGSSDKGKSSKSATVREDKGKGRASVVDVGDDDGDDASDGNEDRFSDLSEWERSQLELAIANSKRTGRVRKNDAAGESSRDALGNSTPPPLTSSPATPPSSTLSTPHATALFTTPPTSSQEAPSLPPPPPSPLAKKGLHLSIQELVRLSRESAPTPVATDSSTTADVPPPPAPARDIVKLILLCSEADIPDVCQCNNPAFQDPLLAAEYPKLVRLLAGHFEAWGRTAGPGFLNFNAWADQCPHMRAFLALAAVNFMRLGAFSNPSRCSPVDFGLYEVPGVNDRFNFYCAGDDPVPMIAVSCGMVEDSQLLTVSDSGLRQKWIRIILHNQEMQRYMGFVRMVSGHVSLHAQYNKHALQFSTRPLRQSPNNPNAKNQDKWRGGQSKGLRVAKSKMFSSAGVSPSSPDKLSADSFSLPAEASVPIYDARGADAFDFQTDLVRLAEALPPWQGGEVPCGSFAVVGHTLSVYRSQAGNWTLGCNIQWVIVVGVPEDD